jgi:starch-binding outer membrane protein, SusD/RagB family
MRARYDSRSVRAGWLVGSTHRLSTSVAALVSSVAIVAQTACTDTAVPYFNTPTAVPASATGIQNAVTGLFGGTRLDQNYYLLFTSGFARDLLEFNEGNPGLVTQPGGLQTIASAGDQGFVWNQEYIDIKQANQIIASAQKLTTYSSAQIAAVIGVVQTIKALNFMYLAETRDTVGIPLYAVDSNPVAPPYCNKDVWQYIVALLDSGEAELNAAGPIPLPVGLQPGFASVGQMAAPSTVQGTFAAFNRALAGKAGLEYAYAIARNSPATHPTPSSPGAPDPEALERADSALTASALYNPSVIAPPVAGNFALDPYGVYHDFSGQSGDLQNPIVSIGYFFFDALYDFSNDVDTVNDLRWQRKFVRDPHQVQTSYAGLSNGYNYLPYATVSSPIPIVRAEELALVRAQIQLGLGNFATAITLINEVHQQAGGFATPLVIAPTYTAVRDSLLKEQRISTVFEGSADRMIALRMYHLEAVADTTWQASSGPDQAVDAEQVSPVDYHNTLLGAPTQEISSRGGTWNLTCP